MINGKYKRVIIIPTIILGIIVFILSYYNLFDIVIDRLTYGVTGDTGSSSRAYIWSMYLNEITQNWKTIFLGVGNSIDPADKMGITPHNAILYLSYQFGFLVSFFYILLALLSVVWILTSQSRMVLNFNIGIFFLFLMTLSEDYLALPYFWLVPCLVFSQNYLKKTIYIKHNKACERLDL